MWKCINGTEWLTANPHQVIGLPQLLSNKCRRQTFGSTVVFPAWDKVTPSDPFRLLPAEIKCIILEDLDRKTVGNLRRVSRSFRQIPTSYFRPLVHKEMPWLWEVLDDPNANMKYDWFELFNTIHTSERLGIFWSKRDEVDGTKLEVGPDYMADLLQEDPDIKRASEDFKKIKLENSLHLCHQLYPAEDPSLRGLRNRKRIWEDVEKIFALAEKEGIN